MADPADIDNPVELTLHLHGTHAHSIRVSVDGSPGRIVFLPFSAIAWRETSPGRVEITAPRWLVEDRGLDNTATQAGPDLFGEIR